MKTIDFQGKHWQVIDEVDIGLVNDPSKLKDNYGCDMVIQNKKHFFILNEIIDVEFEEISEEWELMKNK
tara:strand:- start:477 stop:683 length:207 start_codon:yes stop_codon:yes gene_type:complete